MAEPSLTIFYHVFFIKITIFFLFLKIYPNDSKLSMGDHTYHKSCAKCETCKGQLNIQNFATSGNRLLCKTHFMEEFHSSGGTYGGDDKFKHASRGNEKR
jgi:hypothetical protein